MRQDQHVSRWRGRVSAPACRAVVMAAIVAVAGVVADVALAQSNYPNRPIRVVVGFTAGGPADITTRVIGAKLSTILGQQVVIENRAGAGGMIATEFVSRAEPDGYTLLMTPIVNAINEIVSKNLRYKFGEHLVAVAPLAETANVLVVHPSLGVKSVAELVALAKTKPGDLLYATGGRGTITHLTSEMFNISGGVKLMPVHYRGGGELVKDLVAGEVKIMFASIAPVQGFVKDGRLLALATTGPKRDAAFPQVPTMIESGFAGFDTRWWSGLLAPAGTPRAVIERLSAATAEAVNLPEIKAALAAQGFQPLSGNSEQFGAFYRSEVEKYRTVIQASGITIE